MQSTEAQTPPSVLNQRLRELSRLSNEANQLGSQQQKHITSAERLQDRLVQSERTYGEMLRKSLELKNAIEERRKQIQVDKAELRREQTAMKDTGEQLYQVITKIQRLSGDAYDPKVKQEDHDGSIPDP